jgi:hypothetical protein
MSGIDEVRCDDIPVCPKCGVKPAFWILLVNREGNFGWFWLYSDKYMSDFSESYRLQKSLGDDGHNPVLDEIRQVNCRPDNVLGVNHLFESDTVVFREVMRKAYESDMKCPGLMK